MRVLQGQEAAAAQVFLDAAAGHAAGALCHRSRCGSVVVADGPAGGPVVIGAGRNDPPDGCPLAVCGKDGLPAGFKSDKTCCVHAEQNAILDALRRHPDRVAGSRLYFVRLDEAGRAKPSGRPYCSICSKLTEAAGCAEFVLWHADGISVYGVHEYNLLSFRHADPDPAR